MAKNYTVVPAVLNDKARFVVAGLDGTVIDNADGYGYTTKTKAHKAFAYKRKNALV